MSDALHDAGFVPFSIPSWSVGWKSGDNVEEAPVTNFLHRWKAEKEADGYLRGGESATDSETEFI